MKIYRTNEKAFLVIVENTQDKERWYITDIVEETRQLVLSSGVSIVGEIICRQSTINPKFYIGTGKIEEIIHSSYIRGADVLIFSEDLSGTQQRNLELAFGSKVIDRTQLILDIFAQRAHTNEGKIQVELAQVQYLLPRLSGKGIMLSRLGGGIGTRGPGETKLETDRRKIRQKIGRLKSSLEDIKKHRLLSRKHRKKHNLPSIALVGYTNAGKSVLHNTLTHSGAYVDDRMFSTLDPLARELKLPNGCKVVILDTVGFLHRLPHHLIDAFKATLEETEESDLILHIVDVSHPRAFRYIEAVTDVLKELNVSEKPQLLCLNKVDLLDTPARIKRLKDLYPQSVVISALHGNGIGIMLEKIEQMLSKYFQRIKITIPRERQDLLSLAYSEGNVYSRQDLQEGVYLDIIVSSAIADKFLLMNNIK
ncbi:GTPase HflX [bacterium Unc6]|nr:GTPase HflX [bacterium Unc6]